MSATAKRPGRSPFLASSDRVRHPGGLTQLSVKTIDYGIFLTNLILFRKSTKVETIGSSTIHAHSSATSATKTLEIFFSL